MIKLANPRTRNIFAIFDPKILPNESSGALFKIASTETRSSGREVPNPIIAIPMINSDKPNFLPNDIEHVTRVLQIQLFLQFH